jgi:hypothetical protein
MIESLEDAVSAIRQLNSMENIELCRKKNGDHFTIDSSSSEFLNHASDDEIEMLKELELSASFYFLNESGQTIKTALSKLQKHNFNVVKLPDSEFPFNYAIVTPNFRILFGM